MLATVTLAADHGWFGVWIGSTIGMVAADALAIVIGQQLGARLPERIVEIAAAATFAACCDPVAPSMCRVSCVPHLVPGA